MTTCDSIPVPLETGVCALGMDCAACTSGAAPRKGRVVKICTHTTRTFSSRVGAETARGFEHRSWRACNPRPVPSPRALTTPKRPPCFLGLLRYKCCTQADFQAAQAAGYASGVRAGVAAGGSARASTAAAQAGGAAAAAATGGVCVCVLWVGQSVGWSKRIRCTERRSIILNLHECFAL